MRVNFYLVKDNQNSRRGVIIATFCWHGNRVRITTGESINPKNWKDGTVTKAEDWSIHINQKLSDIRKWAGDLYYEFQQKHQPLSTEVFAAKYREKFQGHKLARSLDPDLPSVVNILKQALEFKKRVVRKRSIECYQTTYNHFVEFTKSLSAAELSKFDKSVCVKFENHLVNRFTSNTTINSNTQFFTTMLNQAVKMGLLESNPYRRNVLTVQEKIHQAYDDQHLKQVMEFLESRDRNLKNFCQFIYYSFARPIEIRRLKIADINFDQRILFVSALGKNKTNRPIEILQPFMDLIESMKLKNYPKDYYIFTYQGIPGPKPIHKNHFNYAFHDYRQELEWDSNYTMYSFKHTGVIQHFIAGYDLRWIQDQCGHSDINTTMSYLRSLGLKINRAKNLNAPII